MNRICCYIHFNYNIVSFAQAGITGFWMSYAYIVFFYIRVFSFCKPGTVRLKKRHIWIITALNYSIGNSLWKWTGYKTSIKSITQFFTTEYWCHSSRVQQKKSEKSDRVRIKVLRQEQFPKYCSSPKNKLHSGDWTR